METKRKRKTGKFSSIPRTIKPGRRHKITSEKCVTITEGQVASKPRKYGVSMPPKRQYPTTSVDGVRTSKTVTCNFIAVKIASLATRKCYSKISAHRLAFLLRIQRVPGSTSDAETGCLTEVFVIILSHPNKISYKYRYSCPCAFFN